jgi:hypothetical protein
MYGEGLDGSGNFLETETSDWMIEKGNLNFGLGLHYHVRGRVASHEAKKTKRMQTYNPPIKDPPHWVLPLHPTILLLIEGT